MASLSTCHLGLWLGWQILLNLVKSCMIDEESGYALEWRAERQTETEMGGLSEERFGPYIYHATCLCQTELI